MALSAVSQAVQGNLILAQDAANRAVELEYAPVEAEITYLEKWIDLNKDKLNRQDAKRQKALEIVLNERKEKIAEGKADKMTIIGWAAEAKKNGAPNNIIDQALKTNDLKQALQILGGYFEDPNAKAMAVAELDYKRLQNEKLRKEINTPPSDKAPEVKEINGVSHQWNSETKKWEPIAGGVSTKNQARYDSLNENINTAIDVLEGKDFVGPNPLARISWTNWATGEKSNFLAGVENLISKETLNTLLELKAAGGTLGQVTEKELNLLQTAASKINQWAIRDKDGKITDIKASEKDFDAEIQRLIGSYRKIQDELTKSGSTPSVSGTDGYDSYLQSLQSAGAVK
jgi:hypothetical protein